MVRLLTDPVSRRLFQNNPNQYWDLFELEPEEQAWISAVNWTPLLKFSNSLVWKRWEEISQFFPILSTRLPVTGRQLFFRYAALCPKLRGRTVWEDAAQFSRFCQDRLAPKIPALGTLIAYEWVSVDLLPIGSNAHPFDESKRYSLNPSVFAGHFSCDIHDVTAATGSLSESTILDAFSHISAGCFSAILERSEQGNVIVTPVSQSVIDVIMLFRTPLPIEKVVLRFSTRFQTDRADVMDVLSWAASRSYLVPEDRKL